MADFPQTIGERHGASMWWRLPTAAHPAILCLTAPVDKPKVHRSAAGSDIFRARFLAHELQCRDDRPMVRPAIRPDTRGRGDQLFGMPDIVDALSRERDTTDRECVAEAPTGLLEAIAQRNAQDGVGLGCVGHIAVAQQQRRLSAGLNILLEIA